MYKTQIVYGIFWLILLIHCIFRRKFYPIIGHGRATKIMWLVTFLFLNPFLNLVYIVYGYFFRPSPKDSKLKPIRPGSIIAVLCICLAILLVNVPYWRLPSSPRTLLRNQVSKTEQGVQKYLYDLESQFLHVTASNKNVVTSRVSNIVNSSFCVGNIHISCKENSELIHQVAMQVQNGLATSPYISSVSYFPYGTYPEQGRLMPDLSIQLGLASFRETWMPLGRKLEADVEVHFGTWPYPGCDYDDYFQTPRYVHLDISGQVQHSSTNQGIEFGYAKYTREAKSISDVINQLLERIINDSVNTFGQWPELPQVVHGQYIETPELALLKGRKAEMLLSGPRIFKHNDTVWRIIESLPTIDALTMYQSELENDGWTIRPVGMEMKPPFLKMLNGNRHIHIFREPLPKPRKGVEVPKPKTNMPIIVHYTEGFREEEKQKAIDALYEADVDILTLLLFNNIIDNDLHRNQLNTLIENDTTISMENFLAKTLYYAKKGETEKATQSLLNARAAGRADSFPNLKKNEIEGLAKRLRNKELAESPIDVSVFKTLGFVDIGDLDKHNVYEKSIDEPLVMYLKRDKDVFETYAFPIKRSPENDLPGHYEISKIYRVSGNPKTISERLKPEDKSITFECSFTEGVGEQSLRFEFKVKISILENGRFEFIVDRV